MNKPIPRAVTTRRRKVLIVGAGIAGPALAYWLHRGGHAVTVVEKADRVRDGGYPVDVRGTALEVVRRMGLLPRLRDAHIDLRRLGFLEGDGSEVATLAPHAVTGGAGHDLEVRRGDLMRALYDTVRHDVEFLFGDFVETLRQSGDGVDVTFHAGGRRTFDVVVGADGMHSRTRRSVFGPEEQFQRYLGYRFAVFPMRNTFGLSRETVMWNAPGRAAALYAVDAGEDVHALLAFAHPESAAASLRDAEARRRLLSEVFADAGWEVPGMLAAMRETDEVFFDAVSQIRMPRWSSGSVALVGDAAYAPSFLTGQGTSLALAGAYMLAFALNPRDTAAGLAAYEAGTREFVSLNQRLVGDGGAALIPVTARDLERRNEMLRRLRGGAPQEARPAHSALALPDSAY